MTSSVIINGDALLRIVTMMEAFISPTVPGVPAHNTPHHSQNPPSFIRSFDRLAEINESLKISNSS